MQVLAKRVVVSMLVAVTFPGLVWAQSKTEGSRSDTKDAVKKPASGTATVQRATTAEEKRVSRQGSVTTPQGKPITSQMITTRSGSTLESPSRNTSATKRKTTTNASDGIQRRATDTPSSGQRATVNPAPQADARGLGEAPGETPQPLWGGVKSTVTHTDSGPTATTTGEKTVTSQGTMTSSNGAIRPTETIPGSSSQTVATTDGTISKTADGGTTRAIGAVKISTTVQGTTTGSSGTTQSNKTAPVEGSTTVTSQ